jgi:hypothetical protein
MKEMSEGFQAKMTRTLRTIGTRFGLPILIALGVLLSASAASANSIYVAQNSAGGNNGADCADARTINSLGSSDWTAGNTIHLCGTITSSLTAQGNGTSSSPITVLFEPGANLTVSACGANGCINLAGSSYIVVDGGTTCGYVGGSDVACNGAIAATGNGTGSGNGESIGIYALGASHIEIRNLNINNMYVHTGSGNDVPPNLYYAIHVDGSNNFIHNNIIHDAGGDIVGEAGTNNSEFSNNQMYNSNWNVFLSGPSSNTPNSITQIKIHDNDMHDYANWDTTSDSFHHDGAIIAGNNNLANGVSFVSIYNNYIHGSVSSCSSDCMTAYIFVNDTNHTYTYNNLIVAPANAFVFNAWIFYWSPGTLQSNSIIANNTVIGGTLSNGGCISVEGDSSMTLQNNILSNCAVLIDVYTSPSTTFTTLTNNIYQASSLSGVWQRGSSYYNSLTSWQSAVSGDSSSRAITTSLNLSSNNAPLSSSIAVGAGANLTALEITALDSDKAGILRPGNGPWDSGAFQSGSSVQLQGPPPAPPTGLRATVQ